LFAAALLLLAGQAHAQSAAGRARYARLIAAEATHRGIPPALADAVATVESAYDPGSVGSSGEIGLMQVLPSTADQLGFRGTKGDLADPATNIRLGVIYLAGAWKVTGGRLCDTLMKYRSGWGEETMSLRSILYCQRARSYLASIGSPLARGPGSELPPITPAMLAADAAGPLPVARRFRPTSAAARRAFDAYRRARLAQEEQARNRWAQLMAAGAEHN
jgi:hypothetical protein